MSGWQPIETAPNEEDVYILTWNGASYDVCSIWWRKPDGSPVWFNGDASIEPTHWMPLPEPPK